MEDVLKQLKQFTANCREDMHEPDEQEISATVVGNELDNAMGAEIYPELLTRGRHELVVILKDSSNPHSKYLQINLATLIALARKAELNNSGK